MVAAAAFFALLMQPEPPAQEQELIAVVKVRRTVLRAEPGPFAEKITVVKRRVKVRVLAQEKRWIQVELPDGETTGWLSRSALKEPRPLMPKEELGTLEPDEGDTGGPALSVKGFDPETEEKFKNQNDLGPQFELLEREIIPKPGFKRNPDELEARLRDFIIEGGLKP
jgi:hypothetical protein